MNAADILKYGHLWVHRHVDDLSEQEMEVPGVCGVWSTKEIIAHLASFEQVLVELFCTFTGSDEPTPNLDQFRSTNGDTFNALQVGKRKGFSPRQALEEYDRLQAEAMALLPKIPQETLRQAGTLPWYGMEYDLEDFLVYSFYGHKREHMAQVAVFRDSLQK